MKLKERYAIAIKKAKELEELFVCLDSDFGPLKEFQNIIAVPLEKAIEYLEIALNYLISSRMYG